jgi:hypothetical protein
MYLLSLLGFRPINALSTLAILYETEDLKQKREIIGSIFSEKLVFDGK